MANYRYIIKSYISHDKFVSGNNEMKKEIKNPEIAVEYTISKQWKPIVSVVRKKKAKRQFKCYKN